MLQEVDNRGLFVFQGTRAQYEALSLNGRTDIALAMLNRTSYPSYGFMVENPLEPSTTLW
eukprot:COSAG05_NODE_3714_length_1887_cov_1.201902_2_plen_60_part_00